MRPSEVRELLKDIKRHGQLGPCASCGWVSPNLPMWRSGWHIDMGGMLCPGCYQKLSTCAIGQGVSLGNGFYLVRTA